jgi:predicted anti-sigma-YlaC factor YlaD
MSECQKLQQELDDYLSDRMSDFDRRRIESHLRQCPPCAGEVNDYREAIEELRSAAQEVAIEPTLSLQFSINRLPSERIESKSISNFHYTSLILLGVLIFLMGTLLSVLDHFGTLQISMTISASAALIGTTVLGCGLIQLLRKYRSAKQ